MALVYPSLKFLVDYLVDFETDDMFTLCTFESF